MIISILKFSKLKCSGNQKEPIVVISLNILKVSLYEVTVKCLKVRNPGTVVPQNCGTAEPHYSVQLNRGNEVLQFCGFDFFPLRFCGCADLFLH